MHSFAWNTTAISSIALRILAYVFFRWIPGHHFPPLIYASFAIFVPAFSYCLTHTEPYEIVSNEIDVVTTDTHGNEDPLNVNDNSSAEEEVLEYETITLQERNPQILKTLLLGVPSPTSLFWSLLTSLINVLLVSMTLDLIYRATLLYPSHDLSMARVGYVSDTSARILVREADARQYPIFASYRYADAPLGARDSSWKSSGRIDWLDNTTDYTGTFTITGLTPDTRYQYVVSNNHGGFIVTAPKVGHTSRRPDSIDTFSFLHTSCIKPNVPYNPFSNPLQIPGIRYFTLALQRMKQLPRMMIFLGDFIYADVPHRHGETIEDFRRQYRQTYSSPDWPHDRAVFGPAADIPWVHVYDDHEVADNWDRNTTGLFAAAYDPYYNYHVSVNPPPARHGVSYFEFTQGPATFFMLDTRRYRSSNDATNGSEAGEPTKTMLGKQQLADLLAWLKRPEPQGVRWKVVVSSIPFTQNWWVAAQDTWRGYLGERQIILEEMWDVGLRGGMGVVILSGDRHEFAATSFPPPPDGKEELTGLGQLGAGANALGTLRENEIGRKLTTRRKRWPLSSTVHEFSASPLNMFYLPIRTYSEAAPSNPYNLGDQHYAADVCIKYIPDGNSKFGSVTISNPATSDQSLLQYRLYVDGEEAWSYTLTTPPDIRGGGRAKDAIWG